MRALLQDLGRRRGIWWLGVAAWAALLFVLSASSSPPTGPDFPFKDKVLHCVYFSGGAFCFVMGVFAGRRWQEGLHWRLTLLCGLAFTAVCGALDEWHQTFTPGRSGNDPWDWTADCLGGVLCGWVAWRFYCAVVRPKARPLPTNLAEAITSGTQINNGS
jgi:VanZ family protein